MQKRNIGVQVAVALIVVLMLGLAAMAQAADAPKAFNQCKACHKVDPGKNGVGPSLFGVYGRAAGKADGFKYSEALLGAGLTWDDATLDKWLTSPKAVAPGSKMAFGGLKNPDDRTAIIQYLSTLK